MKAWQRQLEAWPKEKPRMLDAARSPGWAEDPERIQEIHRTVGKAVTWIFAATFAPAIVGAPLAGYLLASEQVALVPVVAFATFAGMLAMQIFGNRFVAERLSGERHRRGIDLLEAQGEITLGGEAVAIAYSGEFWRHPTQGDEMDKGVLKLEYDRLTFLGRHTRFDLPPSHIVRTEIRRHDAFGVGALPRLYVTWAHEGREETFCLMPPFRASLRRRANEIADLQERIESWRTERRPRLPNRPFQTPPAGKDLTLTPTTGNARKPLALALAAAVAIPAGVLLLTQLLPLLVQWGMPLAAVVVAGLVFLPIAPLAVWIERVLSRRDRDRRADSIEAAHAETVVLGGERKEEEATVRQNA